MAAAAGATAKADNNLHVRGVGPTSEDALVALFAQHGECVQVTVRRREDAAGNDTSWALVTMATSAGADTALQSGVSVGMKTLTITRFSQKQADASTGMMGEVRREASAKSLGDTVVPPR
jgi:hypothetical protein